VPHVTAQPAAEAAAAVARRGYGKLVAFLAARTGDVAAAEDALADAFVAALASWPASGIPRSPEAWLIAVARRRLIDAARRRRTRGDATDHLRLLAEELNRRCDTAILTSAWADVRLRPSGDRSAIRAPLMLQTIWASMPQRSHRPLVRRPRGQRLVAKSKIRQAGIPARSGRMEMPGGWMPCRPRSTPRSPEVGWMRRVAIWPRTRSG
jgi:RNA polymerase sigma-70 factor (ECF subfamily)